MVPSVQQIDPHAGVEVDGQIKPTETVELLMRDLRSSPEGLSSAEAHRRLVQYGPNGQENWRKSLRRPSSLWPM